MKSILRQLYDGQVYPAEQIVSTDPRYRKINNQIHDEREYFLGQLSKEDKERFVKLDSLVLHSSSMDSYASFAYGFRLSTLIMAELVLSDLDDSDN